LVLREVECAFCGRGSSLDPLSGPLPTSKPLLEEQAQPFPYYGEVTVE
jgi:hypothetical protein